ncbi:MAG: CDP-alcohol phosphatidyltransferase family protein [Arsenicicoccus sp.]|uniref:CDP-alcohol phosphatidyltransferase family protein n=1 Tax=Serinicoccus profundi TaxID=1078471 RepID=UPI000255E4DA|nr:CDP-alcohol phosphatidyltransferase family protein [Serinicoccus profundi]PZU48680.1 MAG: CDP-alcohol phosphatidyltransferase family protein [Arsenicicoccus sp.]
MTDVQGDSSGPADQQRVLPVTDRLWTVPNLLSMLRLALVPVFVWALVERELGWAALVLVVAGASDFADGKIARRYGLTSRLGQVLDPIADRLYIAATVLGLAAVGVIPWWLVAVLFARETFIVLMYPVVRAHRLPIPEVTFIGKAATFNLLGGFPLVLLGHVPGWWSVACLATGWALVWWGTVLYWVTGLVYGWQVAVMVRQRRRAGAAR